jgi:hypothetical protein
MDPTLSQCPLQRRGEIANIVGQTRRLPAHCALASHFRELRCGVSVGTMRVYAGCVAVDCGAGVGARVHGRYPERSRPCEKRWAGVKSTQRRQTIGRRSPRVTTRKTCKCCAKGGSPSLEDEGEVNCQKARLISGGRAAFSVNALRTTRSTLVRFPKGTRSTLNTNT